jgi:hypothetical protein
MLTQFEKNNKVIPQTNQFLHEKESVRTTNPFLVNEIKIINLLQQYRIIDKNMNPTWRVKYIKQFAESSSFVEKAHIEVKLRQFDNWLNTLGISAILE